MERCIFIFRNGNDKYIAPASLFDCFEALVTYANNKWKFLDGDTIEYHYSIGDNVNCKLDSQVDFSGLLWLINRDGSDKVEILVAGQLIGFSRSSKDVSHVQYNTNGSGGCNDGEADPAFYVHREKILLSKDWPDSLGDVGTCFPSSFPELRNAICKYQCETGYRTKSSHNNHSKYGAHCLFRNTTGCKWWIYAPISSKDGLLYVKTFYNVHTCKTPDRRMINSAMTSGLVKDLIIDDARGRLDMRPKEVIHRLRESYGFTINYKTAYDALSSAKIDINGDPGRSYNVIKDYFIKLKQSDPSGSYLLETDPLHGIFERAHFAFGASLDGFRACRPIIFMDGTFLKNKFKGTLLTAVGKEGNSGLVPIAFAIVRAEDNANWDAFMQFLRPLVSGRGLVFISDRHPGLINGVRNIFPESHHSFCFRHIKGNLIAKLSGKHRREALWAFEHSAKAPNVELFDLYMADFLKYGEQNAINFLENLPLENFTNVHCPVKRYGELTSNAAESFNNQILKIRELPVAQFVDKIRLMLMTQTYDRSVLVESWTTILSPLRQIEYNENYQSSRTWEVSQAAANVFEVRCDPRMIVAIERRMFSCGKWQIDGFPCEHGVRVLSYAKPDTKYDYIEKFFHTAYIHQVYESKIPALTTFCNASQSNIQEEILPPLCKIPQVGLKVTVNYPRSNFFGPRYVVVDVDLWDTTTREPALQTCDANSLFELVLMFVV